MKLLVATQLGALRFVVNISDTLELLRLRSLVTGQLCPFGLANSSKEIKTTKKNNNNIACTIIICTVWCMRHCVLLEKRTRYFVYELFGYSPVAPPKIIHDLAPRSICNGNVLFWELLNS